MEVAIVGAAAGPGGEPRSLLLLDGRDTGTVLPGAVLETAVRTGDALLLFLTDDVPFEEGLSLCLVDADGKLLDEVRVLASATPGALTDVTRLQDNAIAFEFHAGVPMLARIEPKPRMMLPTFGLAHGIHRKFNRGGRLVVKPLNASFRERPVISERRQTSYPLLATLVQAYFHQDYDAPDDDAGFAEFAGTHSSSDRAAFAREVQNFIASHAGNLLESFEQIFRPDHVLANDDAELRDWLLRAAAVIARS